MTEQVETRVSGAKLMNEQRPMTEQNCEVIDRCLCCNSKKLVAYLDLGRQPLANSYQKEPGRAEFYYPLGLQVCEICFHSQLTHKVDNHLMFDDYPYVSGTSETLNRYFRGFTQVVISSWKGKKPPRVLEIACNDGTLLDMFKQRGCKVNGVEPARNLINLCEGRGLTAETDSEVYCGYWDTRMAQDLLTWEKTKYDIIVAVNVLPHVPNPQEFLEACKLMLDSSTKGSGIYIQTSQCDMFKNGEFDAVYHEHHSYFTATSFGTLAYGTGLEIKEASKVPIHGQSFLFKLGLMTGNGHCDALFDLLEEENAAGWHTVDRYRLWAADVEICKANLLSKLQHYKDDGWTIAGYGASAKCNTVFNYARSNLDYLVDDSHLKWGRYTPGRSIPIKSPELLVNNDPMLLVMTAWNFKEEILQKIRALRPSAETHILTYIPEVKVEPLTNERP